MTIRSGHSLRAGTPEGGTRALGAPRAFRQQANDQASDHLLAWVGIGHKIQGTRLLRKRWGFFCIILVYLDLCFLG